MEDMRASVRNDRCLLSVKMFTLSLYTVSLAFTYPPPSYKGKNKGRIIGQQRALYANLLTSGELQTILANAEEQAQALLNRLMKQRVECEGITAKQIEKATNS